MKITRALWVALSLLAIGCGGANQNDQTTGTAEGDSTSGGAVIETGAPAIHREEVEYREGETVLRGFVAYDESRSDKRPGVLVVHEWWGHNDYARRRATMLAELGYVALAVDMYGDGKQANHPSDAKAFAGAVTQNMAIAEARLLAARNVLEEHAMVDPSKISAIGYCFGGGIVLHAARVGMDLDGVVSFHGSLGTQTPAKPGAIKAKVLVLHGGADPLISPEQVAAFRKEMQDAGADLRFVDYPGAKHAFTNPAADGFAQQFEFPALGYHAEADRQSWEELKSFFAELYPSQGS